LRKKVKKKGHKDQFDMNLKMGKGRKGIFSIFVTKHYFWGKR
jgi:hypothetical protein